MMDFKLEVETCCKSLEYALGCQRLQCMILYWLVYVVRKYTNKEVVKQLFVHIDSWVSKKVEHVTVCTSEVALCSVSLDEMHWKNSFSKKLAWWNFKPSWRFVGLWLKIQSLAAIFVYIWSIPTRKPFLLNSSQICWNMEWYVYTQKSKELLIWWCENGSHQCENGGHHVKMVTYLCWIYCSYGQWLQLVLGANCFGSNYFCFHPNAIPQVRQQYLSG